MPVTHAATPSRRAPTVAEFFAGIGLVRAAVTEAGFDVRWANDIDPRKAKLYGENFGLTDFLLRDIRDVRGLDVPAVALATASFPCTDLSLAGGRAGLAGKASSMFWEFRRVLLEMEDRAPQVLLLENVPSFATSHQGQDIVSAVASLNDLRYSCAVFTLDARSFVPQSRPRLFIVGSRAPLPPSLRSTDADPPWLARIRALAPELDLLYWEPEVPRMSEGGLDDVVERINDDDPRWWSGDRVAAFVDSLSPVQTKRLNALRSSLLLSWATAYRRTRRGRAVWEIRGDHLAGCLRTPRGGSSRQAVVQAGDNTLRIRWMTSVEYARLQGAPNFMLGTATPSEVQFGFGDAVCVPVVSWIARNLIHPLLLHAPLEPTSAVGGLAS